MGNSVPLNELAADWCQAKTIGARSTSGNSDKARRSDLARWGRTIAMAKGRNVNDENRLSLDADLDGLSPGDLSVDVLLAALELLKMTYKPSTLQRLLSNMRGFCRWLLAAGHVESNPFDSELLNVRTSVDSTIRAFTVEDVAAMIDTASTPSPNSRSAWATRDAALVNLLASTGVRSGECVLLQIGDIGGADRPILLVRRGTKSGKKREVPIPGHAFERLETYREDRRALGLPIGPRQPMFIKPTGEPLSNHNLYYIVKRIALAAGATLPDDALVHGFRHHYGLQLALRALPPATLQQLMGHNDPRTTAMYTRHASFDLVNALDDAGWL